MTSTNEGTFSCSINKGVVSNIRIQMKDSLEINRIKNQRLARLDTSVCLIVDEYPVLISDEREYDVKDLKLFIQKKLSYPSTEIDYIGNIYISIIIEKDGTVSSKEFKRKVCKEYDEEAMKVVDMMTNWKPGLINKVPVRTQLLIPINMSIKK